MSRFKAFALRTDEGWRGLTTTRRVYLAYEVDKQVKALEAELATMKDNFLTIDKLNDHLEEMVAKLEAELATIKTQAEDSTEYVLAQLLKEEQQARRLAEVRLEKSVDHDEVAGISRFATFLLTHHKDRLEGINIYDWTREVIEEYIKDADIPAKRLWERGLSAYITASEGKSTTAVDDPNGFVSTAWLRGDDKEA